MAAVEAELVDRGYRWDRQEKRYTEYTELIDFVWEVVSAFDKNGRPKSSIVEVRSGQGYMTSQLIPSAEIVCVHDLS